MAKSNRYVTLVVGDSRRMNLLDSSTVHLIVTSPPYPMIEMWDEMFHSQGCDDYDQMHSYLADTWRECNRVLVEGGMLCINVGDAARTIDNTYKLYPNHARIIEICESIGLLALPYILWKKPTNKPNAFLGSGFLPPNAYVTLDCEYILIFRKGGLRKFPPKDQDRYTSRYTKAERDRWFSQIWDDIRGAGQTGGRYAGRTAAFPYELPKRLIRMFSCVNDVVVDPFAGIGTTLRAARDLGRNAMGYEINEEYVAAIKKTVGWGNQPLDSFGKVKGVEYSIRYQDQIR